MMRMRPPRSTTKSRAESAGGVVRYSGLEKDVLSVWSCGVPGGGGGGGGTFRKLLHAIVRQSSDSEYFTRRQV